MTDTANFPITPGALTAAEIRQRVGKDDPVILEVGTNCGQTTVELLRAMPGATIFAFEPDPRAIAKFRDTIANPRVHLYECAIGAVNGTVSFHQSSGAEHLAGYSEGWDQSGSIRRPNSHLKVWPWVRFEQQITVPIMTLDAWSERHHVSMADFIWADVQGAESDLVEAPRDSYDRLSTFTPSTVTTSGTRGRSLLRDSWRSYQILISLDVTPWMHFSKTSEWCVKKLVLVQYPLSVYPTLGLL